MSVILQLYCTRETDLNIVISKLEDFTIKL